MDIGFDNRKLEKQCNKVAELVMAHGQDRANRIRRRLDALSNTPGRLHELKGNGKGQLSMDLDHPFRLIFVPSHLPVPVKPEGGMDWTQVTP